MEDLDKSPLPPKRSFPEPKTFQQKFKPGEELSIPKAAKNKATEHDDIEKHQVEKDLIEHESERNTDEPILMNSESGRHKGLKETTGDMFYFIEVEGICEIQLHVVSNIKDITEPVQCINEVTETGIVSLEGHQELLTVPHLEDIDPTNIETVSRKFVELLMEKNENENINSVSFSIIAMSVYVFILLLFVYYQ